MTLLQLEYFRTVAKTLHYTRAAESLHISQPSLSYAISELEKELGVPLFIKRSNTVNLTTYGDVFLGYCTRVLETITEAKNVIIGMQDPLSGEIRLGYAYTQFHDLLPKVISNFWDLSGGGQNLFRLRQGNTDLLSSLLLNGDLDVALSFGLDDHPQLESVPLQSQELFLAVPASHPLASHSSCSLSELGDTPLVLLNRFLHVRKYIDSKFAECGMTPNVVAETNDNNMSLSLVAQGVGASIIPYTPAGTSQNVRLLQITHPTLFRMVYFTYNKSRYRPPQVERFIEYVLKILQDERGALKIASQPPEKAAAPMN